MMSKSTKPKHAGSPDGKKEPAFFPRIKREFEPDPDDKEVWSRRTKREFT